MALLEFFPVEVTYRVVDGKAVVLLYGITSKGKRVCVQDSSFDPYFWVVPKDSKAAAEKLARLRLDQGKEAPQVIAVSSHEKRLFGRAITALKVAANQPSSIPALREEVCRWTGEVEEVHEADMKFVCRYLIDKGIVPLSLVRVQGQEIPMRSKVPVFRADSIEATGGEAMEEPRMLAVDIETYNPDGMRFDPENNPILMIALYGKEFEHVLTWKEFSKEAASRVPGIETLPSEADMLVRFKELVDAYGPSVLVGYYSDGFDLPYIRMRASKLKVPLEIGLDFSELRVQGKGKTTADVAGIAHLDLLPFIRRVIGRTMETDQFTLDAVAHELLGEGKIKVDIENLAKAWDAGDKKALASFAAYNLHDARITYKLAHVVLPNLIELVKIIGLPPFDVCRMSFSQMVEWYITRQCQPLGELVPNKPTGMESMHRREEKAKGAFVFEPTPGLYSDIGVVDFRSLYPTIIVTHNISPDTINCLCCKAIAKQVPGLSPPIWFCEKKRGMIPIVLEDLIARRARIKELIRASPGPDAMLAARSEALKVVSNSFYGYLGFAPARWYSHECVAGITGWGRHYITTSIEKAESHGFPVLYSDTDSVFLNLGGKTMADALAFVEQVNQDLPRTMELEFEGFYPSGIFVSTKGAGSGAKKKYALMDEKGRLKIKGFETVRRNWSFIAKDIQKDVLGIVLRTKDVATALDHVKTLVADLRANKVPIDKVVIFTQLQKEVSSYHSIGPHVSAAKRMMQLGFDVKPGTLIKYVVTKGKGKIRDRVKLESEAKQEDYDPDYYIDNQIIPSVDRILAVLGVDVKELFSKEKIGSQATLEGFGMKGT